jgi:hypothetical protein
VPPLGDSLRARVVRIPLLMILAAGAGFGYALAIGLVRSLDGTNADFQQEYSMARALLADADIYQTTATLTAQFAGFSNRILFDHVAPHPPTDAVIFVPFAFLDYRSALLAWWAVQFILLMLAVRYLFHLADVRVTPLGLTLATGIAFLWSPVMLEFALGQLTLPILVLLLAALSCLNSGRKERSGVFLGLSLCFKPIAWPLLILLWLRGERRAATTVIATAGGVLLVAVVFVGWAALMNYVFVVLPGVAHALVAWSLNMSLWSVAWRVFSGTGAIGVPAFGTAPPLVAAPWIAPMTAPVLPALTLSLVLWYARRISDVDAAFTLVTALLGVVSPLGWFFEAILIAPAVAVGSRALLKRRMKPRHAIVALPCLLATEIPPLLSTAYAMIVPMLGIVALAALLSAQMWIGRAVMAANESGRVAAPSA